MGLLVDGSWHIDDVSLTDTSGHWHRKPSLIRHWITEDGRAGPSGASGFKAESGRYHLYVAWNCPWAHRTLLVRHLKQLHNIIGISIAAPQRSEQGWVFKPHEGYVDELFGYNNLHEIYTRSDAQFTGRATVPVLWDKTLDCAVSNESADIVRMLNTAFRKIAPKTADLYPPEQQQAIDLWNDLIHRAVNNGVYRAGFATSQSAYDDAVTELFAALEKIECSLSKTRYLCGDAPNEADWRLLPTLVRFDVAYYSAFKCNIKRLIDFPNLWDYTKRLYATPGIAETVHFDVYRAGYHSASEKRNPHGIVPVAPQINWGI